MEVNNGKYAWMVKIGEKGQFVIRKKQEIYLIFSREWKF